MAGIKRERKRERENNEHGGDETVGGGRQSVNLSLERV